MCACIYIYIYIYIHFSLFLSLFALSFSLSHTHTLPHSRTKGRFRVFSRTRHPAIRRCVQIQPAQAAGTATPRECSHESRQETIAASLCASQQTLLAGIQIEAGTGGGTRTSAASNAPRKASGGCCGTIWWGRQHAAPATALSASGGATESYVYHF